VNLYLYLQLNTIKNNLHEIIDSIEDNALLESVYGFLESRKNQKAGQLWENITAEQRKIVLAAEEGIHYPEKQISHNDMQQRNKKWPAK